MQLAKQTCSPPENFVRMLRVPAQVPSESVILKEKFEFVQKEAKGSGKTMCQTVRWRNSGIRLMPCVSTNWINWIEEHKSISLPLLQFCLMHAVHEEVRDYLNGEAEHCDLQFWVKRNMVRVFEFFRLLKQDAKIQDDPSMRWLLHSRRVQRLPIGDVTQLAKLSAHSLCQRWH